VKGGVHKAIHDRQTVLDDLDHAIREHRKIAGSKPLTLQGADYAHAIQELNKAIDRAEVLGGRVDSWSRHHHFSLDFLDFPCDTNTMNIVLNALTAFTSYFSVRLQEAVGRSHATELAKPVSPRQLEATIG